MKRMIGIAAAIVTLSFAAGGLTASADPAPHQQSDIYRLSDLSSIDGASAQLTRSNGGVNITFNSSGFDSGDVVTIWVFSFSNPGNCDHGGLLPDGSRALCGMGDDGADDTGFQLLQLAGHVVGAEGQANFGAQIKPDNPLGAEFHVAAADHGPLDPAQMPGAIMSGAMPVQIAFFVPTV
jgi:hypothetical protein